MLFNIAVVVRLLNCSFKFTSALTFIFAVICSSMLATALIKYEKQIQRERENWQKVMNICKHLIIVLKQYLVGFQMLSKD